MTSTPGPFASVAHDLRKLGLAVIPTPGDDGKSPEGSYAFRHWRRPAGSAFVEQMIRDHGNDNVGIVTDLSRRKLTVIDVDDAGERVQLEAVRRFGDTPLATLTPSGGLHLWYQHNGEPSTDLRRSEGTPIEIKSASSRLLVIVPPSYRRPGGDPYFLVQGSWDDLERLPPIKPGALPSPKQARAERLQEGARNDALWRQCMRQARHCDDLDALLDCARTFARDRLDLTGTTHRMTDAEIRRTAESAWRYETEGRNLFGVGGAVILGHCEIDALAGQDAAFQLYLHLARQHDRASMFPIAKSRAAALGWSVGRLKRARDVLMSKGIIVCIRPGGRGPNDPPVYHWKKGVADGPHY